MTKKTCLVIGYPVSHSLSPAMHNAAYRALNVESEFEYSTREVKPENLESEAIKLRDPSICGVSVTIPHKIEIIKYLDEVDEVSKKIGAVNTLYKKGKKLCGTNTDWIGVQNPLEQKIILRGKKAAVYGAGGAARAACYALTCAGVSVIIVNRTKENAQKTAADFNCGFASLEEIKSFEDLDIILNSIPYQKGSGFLPFNPALFVSKNIFFDMVYLPHETELISGAKAKGAMVIHGIEMLLYQGAMQFKIFTGLEAPVDTMREALLKSIS